MKSKMFIPEKINVGFQNRTDTYTGKLAYVTYYDKKNVLRKEKSWNGWRDQKIPNEKFENKPLSGFVLNKGVGGTRQSYGWNPRNEYIRVYDPREFEFEISVANLLFILQETSSIKGKGLEGEFIYAWDRAELVLLPVSSKEYNDCANYTDLQDKKITKKDIKEGCAYITKDQKNVMYIGNFDWYECESRYDDYYIKTYKKKGKYHVFLDLDFKEEKSPWDYYGKNKYWIQKGYTKLAEKVSDQPLPQFAEAYDELSKSSYVSPVVKIITEPDKPGMFTDKRFYRSSISSFMEYEGKVYSILVEWDKKEQNKYFITRRKFYEVDNKELKEYITRSSSFGNDFERAHIKDLNKEQVYELTKKAYAICENGARFQLY